MRFDKPGDRQRPWEGPRLGDRKIGLGTQGPKTPQVEGPESPGINRLNREIRGRQLTIADDDEGWSVKATPRVVYDENGEPKVGLEVMPKPGAVLELGSLTTDQEVANDWDEIVLRLADLDEELAEELDKELTEDIEPRETRIREIVSKIAVESFSGGELLHGSKIYKIEPSNLTVILRHQMTEDGETRPILDQIELPKSRNSNR